jgi:hypothetical protein
MQKRMDGSKFPLRKDRMEMEFSSTDDDLRDAMAWHTPERGVRGVAWHAIPCHTRAIAFIITIQDSRSPKTNTT